jgi:hypothetical protein
MVIYSSQTFLQLPGEQVPLKSAFQTFTLHFKEPLLCSRLESGIQNENEHEPAGEEITVTMPVRQRIPPKEPTRSLPQQPRLTEIYFSICASAKFPRSASKEGKNRGARNAVVLPFVTTANLSNCARSVTVPRFAAILRGNGFAESAKGPRLVSMEGERQKARSAQGPI